MATRCRASDLSSKLNHGFPGQTRADQMVRPSSFSRLQGRSRGRPRCSSRRVAPSQPSSLRRPRSPGQTSGATVAGRGRRRIVIQSEGVELRNESHELTDSFNSRHSAMQIGQLENLLSDWRPLRSPLPVQSPDRLAASFPRRAQAISSFESSSSSCRSATSAARAGRTWERRDVSYAILLRGQGRRI